MSHRSENRAHAYAHAPGTPTPPSVPRDAMIRRDPEDRARWIDRHRRDAATCRASAALAQSHLRAILRVWQSLDAGEIVFGREAGPSLLVRLFVSYETLDALAKRDREWALALDAAAEWDRACEAALDSERVTELEERAKW